jgi:hypothetical protein
MLWRGINLLPLPRIRPWIIIWDIQPTAYSVYRLPYPRVCKIKFITMLGNELTVAISPLVPMMRSWVSLLNSTYSSSPNANLQTSITFCNLAQLIDGSCVQHNNIYNCSNISISLVEEEQMEKLITSPLMVKLSFHNLKMQRHLLHSEQLARITTISWEEKNTACIIPQCLWTFWW